MAKTPAGLRKKAQKIMWNPIVFSALWLGIQSTVQLGSIVESSNGLGSFRRGRSPVQPGDFISISNHFRIFESTAIRPNSVTEDMGLKNEKNLPSKDNGSKEAHENSIEQPEVLLAQPAHHSYNRRAAQKDYLTMNHVKVLLKIKEANAHHNEKTNSDAKIRGGKSSTAVDRRDWVEKFENKSVGTELHKQPLRASVSAGTSVQTLKSSPQFGVISSNGRKHGNTVGLTPIEDLLEDMLRGILDLKPADSLSQDQIRQEKSNNNDMIDINQLSNGLSTKKGQKSKSSDEFTGVEFDGETSDGKQISQNYKLIGIEQPVPSYRGLVSNPILEKDKRSGEGENGSSKSSWLLSLASNLIGTQVEKYRSAFMHFG